MYFSLLLFRVSFYECAPGLKDLLRIGQHDWDEPSQLDISQLRRSPRKKGYQRQSRMDSDDEDEDDVILEEDEDEEDDEEDEEYDELGELPPSTSRSKHRASR